jgi:NADH:ubiquinone oxidoreductase subunit 5 (subunit L)/multisubunit Na+/H+ antiporter MnhA subunit
VQNDIKRVVAYSTLSQLGYMTVALGVSAYSAAVFHLMTHAFFKALLFLGAGSVIIAMHHEQDMRRMGGLRKYMPITWITMPGSARWLWSARRFFGLLLEGCHHRGGAVGSACMAAPLSGMPITPCCSACSSPASTASACCI